MSGKTDTMIRVEKDTVKMLKGIGTLGETYNDVIKRLVLEYEQARK